jgi:hypothetical protein
VPCGTDGLTDSERHRIQNLGTRYVGQEGNYEVFTFPSGTYHLSVPWQE